MPSLIFRRRGHDLRSIYRVQDHADQVCRRGDLQQLPKQVAKSRPILIPTSPQRRVVRVVHARQPQHSDVVITGPFPPSCAPDPIHVPVEHHFDLEARRIRRPPCLCLVCFEPQSLQIQGVDELPHQPRRMPCRN